ncbi:MAG: bifunctional demethylmenaquinone methyltransferase/2-methoxy-6-polyprenyl-1,4-benzoquinol methylase UbiE [Cyclobacteriaceae bacterium]|jgi:demethylmenaquinone methyltransferase/2-methoxy-6-polyprenyl-1,4-benzoquinol methylase
MVVPYKNAPESKKQQVARMFDSISGRYDQLNHLLSLGIDRIWRRKAIHYLKKQQPTTILDVATGTADFAIEAGKIKDAVITGVDISEGMLEAGRKKIARLRLDKRIFLQTGDSENLPFDDNTFDASIVAFGVRNFEDLDKGLREIHRVIRPGGHFVILEISEPHRTPWKQLFSLYFHTLLPLAGRLISSDKHAYTYLPESVAAFPKGPAFIEKMEKAGFSQCQWKPLTLGICAMYVGQK